MKIKFNVFFSSTTPLKKIKKNVTLQNVNWFCNYILIIIIKEDEREEETSKKKQLWGQIEEIDEGK